MPGINLTATTHSLEVEIAGTGTLSVDIQASATDQNSTTYTPVSNQLNATGAGTVTALAAPAASTQRSLGSLTVVNRGTQPVTAMVKKDVSGTEFDITAPVPLDPNWLIEYTPDSGFMVKNALGMLIGCDMAGYALLKAPTLLTSGTTYTPSVNCAAILIELFGPGGGGSGAVTGATAACPGTGGAAGGMVCKFIVGVPASITYNIGPAGAGGVAGNNAGSAGASNTTMTINGVTYTATAGSGGPAPGAAGTGAGGILGGAAVSGTSGDENLFGEAGGTGIRFSGTAAISGAGADSIVGSGGLARVAAGAGVAGSGFAAGGSGGLVLNGSASVAGGPGLPGCIRVWEYAVG